MYNILIANVKDYKNNKGTLSFRHGRGDEPYGILEQDFATVRHDWKLQELQAIMPVLKDSAE